MRAIIIGAGRGSRLEHHTRHIPKTLVEVMGRPMLDWILEALNGAGIGPENVVFICGYAEHEVKKRYPEFSFVTNDAWESNNILASLMYARSFLSDGAIVSYADIVYDADIASRLVKSVSDITLGCDTAWRRRYLDRQQHPESDAEKLRARGSRVVELSRRIESEQAQGEFIGVMKVSPAGGASLCNAYDRAQAAHARKPYREGRPFERAYLIDLLQDMLENGVEMRRENTPGCYMEIDTVEDLAHAERWWNERG